MQIRIDVAPWRGVPESLARGTCQFGIAFDSVPRRHFAYEPLFRETQQLCCGTPHPLYGQRIREPAVLSDAAFVLTRDDEPEELTKFRNQYVLGSHAAVRVEDLREVARLIQFGIGVGFLPTAVASLAAQGRLWPLLAGPLLAGPLLPDRCCRATSSTS